MNILIADDDSIARRLTERMLRQMGYHPTVAENGREAAEKLLDQNGPRLALLDWMMPGLDGPQVCQQLRAAAERPYVYMILLTAKDSRQDLIAGLEAGADDYLTKPCHPEELNARLRTGLRILKLEDTLVQAREEMRFKATHDALTLLWNRGKILEILNSKLARRGDSAQPLSIVLGDVDHFKAINDVYGHLVGDAVLSEVAFRLRRAVRPDDAIGRYGGEEFLVILEGCAFNRIEERTEQLRTAIAADSFSSRGASFPVTISFGALAIEGRDLTQTPEELLSRCDVALYQAKMRGRNRVVLAESPVYSPVPIHAELGGLPMSPLTCRL